VPAVWFTSLMGVIFCAGMAAALPAETWWRLVLWSAIGIAIYLVYGYSHSRLRLPEERESASGPGFTKPAEDQTL
jgi:basic amino acid/polyamine antiporter, APA family